MDKKTIARNFSRCALRYDEYANIQRIAAVELIKELPGVGFNNILEIGCGTGIYTGLLRERFNGASIRSVDIAEKMVDVARGKFLDKGITFTVEDAEDMEPEGSYDLVTSNAAGQWFRSMEGMMDKYKTILRGGGVLAFSVFGPLTFMELSSSLDEASSGRGFSVASRYFLGKEALEEILARYLRDVSVREALIKEKYPSLAKLLEKIKYTGVRGSASGNGFMWSRGLLKKAEDAYIKNYGSVVATYQIFLCKALR